MSESPEVPRIKRQVPESLMPSPMPQKGAALTGPVPEGRIVVAAGQPATGFGRSFT